MIITMFIWFAISVIWVRGDHKVIQDRTHTPINRRIISSWGRHQMETFSALLAICAGNSPHKKPVTRSFNVFFDLRLNQPLSKQWWGWWFETLSRSVWLHCNGSSPCLHGITRLLKRLRRCRKPFSQREHSLFVKNIQMSLNHWMGKYNI